MSNQALTWVLDDEDLPQGPKMVMVAIANHADHTDGYCWLKAATIAREAACTERSVYRVIAALIRNGYLRYVKKKGADGKQRANDYWILLDRKPAPWAWRRATSEDDDPLDIGGENAPSDMDDTRETQPQESVGPHDSHSVHTYTEPPKTNLRETNFGLEGNKPRGYRAPPLALEVVPKPEKVFVIEGSRAWQAWVGHRKRSGQVGSLPTTRGQGENAGKSGWYLPSLFPPAAQSTGPPSTLMTDEDYKQFG